MHIVTAMPICYFYCLRIHFHLVLLNFLLCIWLLAENSIVFVSSLTHSRPPILHMPNLVVHRHVIALVPSTARVSDTRSGIVLHTVQSGQFCD